jgi:hypothetical protein
MDYEQLRISKKMAVARFKITFSLHSHRESEENGERETLSKTLSRAIFKRVHSNNTALIYPTLVFVYTSR